MVLRNRMVLSPLVNTSFSYIVEHLHSGFILSVVDLQTVRKKYLIVVCTVDLCFSVSVKSWLGMELRKGQASLC